MIVQQKGKKKGQKREAEAAEGAQGPKTAKSCKDLLKMMPLGFNPSAVEGLSAIYQFEVAGEEDFVAHLLIAEGRCTYVDGPAQKPDVIIKTPPDIWLAIAKGEMDGQQAFMSGKYKVEGDLGLLLKLRVLFS
ncbi:MAG: SCP2 sterol-binding domain-containing protein [Candidatus Tectomicrobia bacterium]|uniref:SCP2 sterol-binding domain-containing protein n=1 Tax=Tectimicrobiota bacterium TaxID=2528274 RepID=A0A933GN05_UNCTE|nr:SCP2 sterol-binding domain-containing protein [Candidatus Tectomicrobia bacterium]